MDDGGNKSEFELEVNDKDTELVSADIESPGDEGDELPVDDKKVVEGDLPAPEKDPMEDELDSELDALEAEEKAEEEAGSGEASEEEKAAEAADAAEASEETTVAADAEAAEEEKPEEEAPAEETPEEEKPAEEEPVEEDKADDPTEEDKTEEEKPEEAPAEDVPAEEEKPEEEAPAEEAPVEEKAEEDKAEEEAPIVVNGENAPVDSTQANSQFPVEPAEEKKKSNKTGIFVMIAVIALLLIGIGIFFIMGGGLAKNEKKDPQGNTGGGSDEPKPSKVIGMSEFDVKLLKDLSSAKNNVYSPMSIKYAMSILMEGTDGDTKKELEDVIGSYEPNKYTTSDHLAIANAIFVRDDFKTAIRTAYTDAIKEKYGANAIYDPFNSAATINDWVYTNTLKLIPEVISDDDLKEARFVIANTVAIDMEWENIIQCSMELTSKCKDGKDYAVSYKHEKYHDYVNDYDDNYRSKVKLNGKEALALEFAASINNYDIVSKLGEDTIRSTVKDAYNKCVAEKEAFECDLGGSTIDKYLDDYVEAIGKNYGKEDVSTDFKMYVDENVKMFAKDFKEYDGAQLQYISIMPTSTSLSDYIKGMTLDKLKTLVGSLKDVKKENFADGKVTRIRGVVPEFDFNEKYDLIEEFQALGVNKVFTKDADLSKMLEDGVKDVEVGKIKHAAKIEFSNTGVKAAGATVIIGVGSAMEATFDYEFDVPVEEIDMTFDKPFMYLIRDKATGEIWFMGTVYEGLAQKKG